VQAVAQRDQRVLRGPVEKLPGGGGGAVRSKAARALKRREWAREVSEQRAEAEEPAAEAHNSAATGAGL
jgi:hypothetical protein